MIKQFECGCKIDTNNINLDKINQDCPKVWELFCSGLLKGCFQLESALGAAWSTKIKPKTIEETSDLIALIRPGCLNGLIDDKSMTKHYLDRRNGEEKVEFLHDCLIPILGPTQGMLVYQESLMEISRVLAGFNETEVDSLRKSVGKKESKLLFSLEEQFVNGCDKIKLVTKEQGKALFETIKASARYSFNLSHSVSYATLCYQTAYIKCHFPLEFYTSWLRHAEDKIDPKEEIRELVADLRKQNIQLVLPSPTMLYENFSLVGDKIVVGLSNFKNIGHTQASKLIELINSLNKKPSEIGWIEFLYHIADKSNQKAIESLIKVGVFNFGHTREFLLHDLFIWNKLTQREKDSLGEKVFNLNCVSDAIHHILLGKVNKRRVITIKDLQLLLDNPPYSLNDTPSKIVKYERGIVGFTTTFHITDLSSLYSKSTLKEFSDGKSEDLDILCEILSVRDYSPKTGKNVGKKMCFLSIEDATDRADAVVFPKELEVYKNQLYSGNLVILSGLRSKYNSKSLIVNKVTEI